MCVRIFNDKLLPLTVYRKYKQGSSHLVQLLMINSATYSERKKIKSKIIYMLRFPRTLLDVVNMDVTLLPRVLKVIADESGSFYRSTVSSRLFYVIRQMVPKLFGFPSAERLRFEARIHQVEVENRGVRRENERLSKVEMENEALRKQINQLKRDLGYSIGAGGRKRSRRIQNKSVPSHSSK